MASIIYFGDEIAPKERCAKTPNGVFLNLDETGRRSKTSRMCYLRDINLYALQTSRNRGLAGLTNYLS